MPKLWTGLKAAVLGLLLLAGSAAHAKEPSYPITIKHALGTTVIAKKPQRVATVAYANHEVPLALGVVPVGFAKANFGDDDDDGLLPWVAAKLKALGAPTPPLFNEGDGIDFEAVAATRPDVILAAYSGLSRKDYETLSRIAPVVAYPEGPWATAWRDMIRLNSTAMGMAAQGDALIARLEKEIADAVAQHPQLAGKTAMFITHLAARDLSKVNFYLADDTRVRFFRRSRAHLADERRGRLRAGQILGFDQHGTHRPVRRCRYPRHLRQRRAARCAVVESADREDAGGGEEVARAAWPEPGRNCGQSDAAFDPLGA